MDEFASIKPFLLGLVGDDTSEEEELQPEEVTATMVAVTVYQVVCMAKGFGFGFSFFLFDCFFLS